jgi:hypothetical protein
MGEAARFFFTKTNNVAPTYGFKKYYSDRQKFAVSISVADGKF